jgi:hypothetical protein
VAAAGYEGAALMATITSSPQVLRVQLHTTWLLACQSPACQEQQQVLTAPAPQECRGLCLCSQLLQHSATPSAQWLSTHSQVQLQQAWQRMQWGALLWVAACQTSPKQQVCSTSKEACHLPAPGSTALSAAAVPTGV